MNGEFTSGGANQSGREPLSMQSLAAAQVQVLKPVRPASDLTIGQNQANWWPLNFSQYEAPFRIFLLFDAHLKMCLTI